MGLDMYLYASAPAVDPDIATGHTAEWMKEANLIARKLADSIKLPADNAGIGNYGSVDIKRAAHDDPNVTVKVHAGYWRKANHIHQWFVDKVQNGIDECEEHPVSLPHLRMLKADCQKVLELAKVATGPVQVGTYLGEIGGFQVETPEVRDGGIPIVHEGSFVTNPDAIAEILPTTHGFFFGGADYDQWYLADCGHTIDVVDACLAAYEANPAITFSYCSSW